MFNLKKKKKKQSYSQLIKLITFSQGMLKIHKGKGSPL